MAKYIDPIAPFKWTPEGIKAYQKNQPFPDLEAKRIEWAEIYTREATQRKRKTNSADIQKEVEKKLTDIKKRGTTISWSKTGGLVYVRDQGICDICDEKFDPRFYECGHIVDRVCGGSDRLENLVCMCVSCNRNRKPLHDTKEEYRVWNFLQKAQKPKTQMTWEEMVAAFEADPEIIERAMKMRHLLL